VSAFPLPGTGEAAVAVPAPGDGPGWWAGAPCAALEDDGTFVLGYRVRNGHDGNDQTVVARSDDGVTFTPVARLDETDFGAMGMERPALARTDSGGWRLYVCMATPDSAHWWIDVLEAERLEELPGAEPHTAFPGDHRYGVKDPIVQRADGAWRAWICCHLLEEKGEEDRMLTAYATSADGFDWELSGPALEGRPGMWDARGARLTTVLPDGRAAYDGRATAEENWFEQTGLARLAGAPGALAHDNEEPSADVRYLDVVPLPDGGVRIFYEQRLPDESHELRTELIAAN
jgi:hypothetical protein